LAGWLALTVAQADSLPDQRTRFQQAWNAAAQGDRSVFEKLGPTLQDYTLYPYLRYEDLRARRAKVGAQDMAAFLDQHRDWAFAPGLRAAWLRTLGERSRWPDLLRYASGPLDTETRCYVAAARIAQGQTEGLLGEVQALWAVGKSQPDACDPACDWLRAERGITPALAWERVRLAMAGGNVKFARYLERFLPEAERDWLRLWQDLDRRRYRGLEQTARWPDQDRQRMIVSTALQRMAKQDPERAMQVFNKLDGHFSWPDAERGTILRAMAMSALVDLDDRALDFAAAVPQAYRDSQLQEWWARAALARSDWVELERVTAAMPPETAADGRWRYWRATALRVLGDGDAAQGMLESLAGETTYFGFLAADALNLPYTICGELPEVRDDAIDRLRRQPDFVRALELRASGVDNWALSEWVLATGRLDTEGLRAAAALAWQESWYDRVIHALGDSGDRRYYEWRFPLHYQQTVDREAGRQLLDKSWVLGVMRSESALAENARSPAGAMGLMQITPDTARRLARQHGLSYSGLDQLRQADANIRFGTVFMRELMDRYRQNPVLVAGAYNAGPQAVDRWLKSRPLIDTAAWVETIPYFETRDYIPRVLAFTAIYDWRLGQPVRRVSSRMPAIDSGNMKAPEAAEVVCRVSGQGG